MRYFDFEKAKIAYEDLGNGKPVILIHGAVVADPWGKFKQLLAQTHRVIAIHLPGFGNSQVVHGKVHDTELFARAVCSLARQLEITDAPVIALSLGTIVAVKAAEREGLTGKLFLVGVPTGTRGLLVKLTHFIPKIFLRQVVKVRWIREKVIMASLRVNVGRHREELEWSRKFAEKVSKTSPEAIADVDYVAEVANLPHILNSIPNQKTYIYGEYDVQKARAAAWGIKYTTIKNSGHDVFSDQPQATIDLVDSRL